MAYLNMFYSRTIILSCIAFGLSNSMVMASLPQIDYRNVSEMIAGEVPDGMVLGHGRVSDAGAHQGFSVWLESSLKGNEPGHYILRGKTDAQNILRIRLEEENWKGDNQSAGILIRTREQSASFFVLTDGNQHVPADKWTLEFMALSHEN